MKLVKRTVRPGRLTAWVLLTCLPLLTGCNPGLEWGYAVDWYALIVFAPLRSLYGSVALDLINRL